MAYYYNVDFGDGFIPTLFEGAFNNVVRKAKEYANKYGLKEINVYSRRTENLVACYRFSGGRWYSAL